MAPSISSSSVRRKAQHSNAWILCGRAKWVELARSGLTGSQNRDTRWARWPGDTPSANCFADERVTERQGAARQQRDHPSQWIQQRKEGGSSNCATTCCWCNVTTTRLQSERGGTRSIRPGSLDWRSLFANERAAPAKHQPRCDASSSCEGSRSDMTHGPCGQICTLSLHRGGASQKNGSFRAATLLSLRRNSVPLHTRIRSGPTCRTRQTKWVQSLSCVAKCSRPNDGCQCSSARMLVLTPSCSSSRGGRVRVCRRSCVQSNEPAVQRCHPVRACVAVQHRR